MEFGNSEIRLPFIMGKKTRRLLFDILINQDIKNRKLVDKHRLSPSVFRDLWSHPALYSFRDNDNLVFHF